LLIRLARELAVLHVEMHRLNAPPHIPSQSERLVHKVKAATDLGPALQEVVIHELESMPVGNQLCHGDFHPGNVMMGDKPTIIDWIDATSGNPLADVARTSILLMGIPQMTEKMPWLVKTLLNWYHRIYLKHYFHTRPQSLNEYRRWLPIIAAGRMDENITELNPWLRKQVEKGLDITPKAIQVILTH
jgi:aminoglycoside phosphotransferase (APT) family kinase protein